MRPPERTGTGKCHRQKMILFCRLGTRYREPAACDHRRDSRATYTYTHQSAGEERRSSEPRGAGPLVEYQSSTTSGRPYDPAASGSTGRCTYQSAGKERRSSEPPGAGPPMEYRSIRTDRLPYDPAASGDAGRCTRKQAGIDHIAWAGAGERRRSRSEPGTITNAN